MGAGTGAGQLSIRRSWLHQALYLVIVSALLAAACFRITSTWDVFSHTFDETAHLAAGMEFLDKGNYRYDPLHPPLSRIAIAAGPYLAGHRSHGLQGFWREGHRILFENGVDGYFAILKSARAANLIFFVLAGVFTTAVARRLYGRKVAILACLLFSTTPVVLAHAGLATTDMAFVAFFSVFVLTLINWLEHSSWRNAVIMYFAAGLALSSKMSALVFLPVTFAFAMCLDWFFRRSRWRDLVMKSRAVLQHALLSVLIVGITLWASYGFSVGTISEALEEQPPYRLLDSMVGKSGWFHDAAYMALDTPVPAPEFLAGIASVVQRNHYAPYSYLLGEHRARAGFPLFFPVAIGVKTTLGLLALLFVGAVALIRSSIGSKSSSIVIPLSAIAAALLVVLPSSINIGVRHVLHIYPMIAIVGAYGLSALWRFPSRFHFAKLLGGSLMIWHLSAAAIAHPDYLSYFNEIAGDHPEKILLDSDLDWGQDAKRLTDAVNERGITELWICFPGSKEYLKRASDATLHRLKPYEQVVGWVAVSVGCLQSGTRKPPYDQFAWLLEEQYEAKIGNSLRLYHLRDRPSN